jgi:hypothetical protein
MESYIDFVIEYKNGKQEIKVVNGPGVKCRDLPTDKIVKKLMGEDVEITDFAHTDQYFDEQAQNSPQQEESSQPFIHRKEMDEPNHRQEIDA